MNSENTQSNSRYLKWAVVGVLYLVLLTPALVSSKFVFPFITTKTIWFRILMEIAGILWVSLFLFDQRYRPTAKKLSLVVVIFGLIVFLTAITGLNFYKSFWGTIERGEGFLTVSHIILYFLILSSIFKSKKEWFYYLTGAVIVSLAVDVYALAQKMGADWVIHSGEGRVSATIGNASFLSGYLLLSIFFCIYLFVMRRNIYWRIFFILAIIFDFFILINTQTRGALVGLVISTFLVSLMLIFGASGRRVKTYFSLVLVGLILTAGGVWFGRNSSLVQKVPALVRLTTISYNDITTQSRLLTWQASLKGFQDRPVLGFGWENYNIAFNRYFPNPIFKDAGSQLWFDRAHNYILDVMVATGTIGLVAYLAIFGVAFYILFISYKRNVLTYLQASLLFGGIVAYVIQNVFVFDTLATYLTFYALLAYINFIDSDNEAPIVTARNQDGLLLKYAILILVWLTGFIAIYNFNIKPVKANMMAINALIAANQNKELEAIALFKKAIDMNTYQTPELRQKLADNILLYNRERGMTAVQIADNYNYVIEEINKNIKAYPYDVQNFLYLMTIYNASDNFDASRLDLLIELGDKALKLSPTRPQIYFEMGQARMTQNKLEEGLKYFEKARDLSPETVEANWNLWAAYSLAKRRDQALEVMNKLLALGYQPDLDTNIRRNLSVYVGADDKEKVAEYAEKIAQIDPSPDNIFNVAIAYRDLQQYDKARSAALKSLQVEHNQDFEQKVKLFLSILDQAAGQQ